jgi:hypothetical protein
VKTGYPYGEACEVLYLAGQQLITELDLEVELHRQSSLRASTRLARLVADVEAKLSGAEAVSKDVADMVEAPEELIKFDKGVGMDGVHGSRVPEAAARGCEVEIGSHHGG